MDKVKQYGGNHYESEYGHWDWVTDIGMGYLPGNATKYVARWRKKNGAEDLRKAVTYIDKMMSILEYKPNYEFNRRPNSYTTRVCTDRFVEVNGFVGIERSVIEVLSGSCSTGLLKLAKLRILDLIQDAQSTQRGAGTVAPGSGSTTLQEQKTGACGGASRTTIQPPATSASTEGMEHPFGYDGQG